MQDIEEATAGVAQIVDSGKNRKHELKKLAACRHRRLQYDKENGADIAAR